MSQVNESSSTESVEVGSFFGPEAMARRRREQIHREEFWEDVHSVGNIVGRLATMFVALAASVDLFWRGWRLTAQTFPMWHIPVTSLHHFAEICAFFIGAFFLFNVARRENRNYLPK